MFATMKDVERYCLSLSLILFLWEINILTNLHFYFILKLNMTRLNYWPRFLLALNFNMALLR